MTFCLYEKSSVCGETILAVCLVLKDGLSTLHVPYSYGFAIILLTVLVKVATFPLTKQQVESTLAMQNLQPKIKAIQERYKGNQERIQLETSRLYRQAGVNPLAGCLPTLATIPVWIGLYQALSNVANEGLLTEGFFWIPSLGGQRQLLHAKVELEFPGSFHLWYSHSSELSSMAITSQASWRGEIEGKNIRKLHESVLVDVRCVNGARDSLHWEIAVDGHPPLGWNDTAAYLVLPVLLVVSQYVSMELMKPPETDPSQKNSLLILKFLPLMIGYFSLSVPSGLSIYWFTNNVLSTAQQVWLRKLGGAKPVVNQNANGIISAGKAKRSASQPAQIDDRLKQFKEDSRRQQKSQALPKDQVSVSGSEMGSDEESKETKEVVAWWVKDEVEEKGGGFGACVGGGAGLISEVSGMVVSSGAGLGGKAGSVVVGLGQWCLLGEAVVAGFGYGWVCGWVGSFEWVCGWVGAWLGLGLLGLVWVGVGVLFWWDLVVGCGVGWWLGVVWWWMSVAGGCWDDLEEAYASSDSKQVPSIPLQRGMLILKKRFILAPTQVGTWCLLGHAELYCKDRSLKWTAECKRKRCSNSGRVVTSEHDSHVLTE
ncbi:Inner membrane protein ALBINO3 chloroplastic [Bienertia sinuspersici]